MVLIRLTAIGVTVAGLLGLVGVATADLPPDDPRLKAQAAIVALSNNLSAPDADERAKKIVAEFDSCDISTIFMPKRHRGLGIGKLAKDERQDSVRHLVLDLSRSKTLTEADLEQNQADYLRVAKALQAMALLAPYRAPDAAKTEPQLAKDWAAVSATFKVRTASFRQAIDEQDPKKVRLAAIALQQNCNDCHVLRR